jgi:hypothetical protein
MDIFSLCTLLEISWVGGMRELPPEPTDEYLCLLYTGGKALGCGMRELSPEPMDGYLALCTLVEISWVVE